MDGRLTFDVDPEEDYEAAQALQNALIRGKDSSQALWVLLSTLDFFTIDDNPDPAMIARQNYAKKLLRMLGIWHSENLYTIVKGFTTVPKILPLPYEERKEEEPEEE